MGECRLIAILSRIFPVAPRLLFTKPLLLGLYIRHFISGGKNLTTILNISGKAQHGKDTLAEILADLLRAGGYRVQVIKFADSLKEEAVGEHGWNGEKDKAGRDLLQTLGTYKRENVDIDYWVKKAEEKFKGDLDFILIPDTRYKNEIDYFRGKPGYRVITIRIERWENGELFDNGLTPEQKAHSSEVSLDNYTFDYWLQVNSGHHNLINTAIYLVRSLVGEAGIFESYRSLS